MLRRNAAHVDAPANSVFCMFSHVKFICIALGFRDIRLRRKYGSRLGHASLAACTACSARRVREPEASRLLRSKHANANLFALLSASVYICTANGKFNIKRQKHKRL